MIVVVMMVNTLFQRSERRRRFYRRSVSFIEQRAAESAESVRSRIQFPAFGALGPGGWAGGLKGRRSRRFGRVAFPLSNICRKRLDGLQRDRHGFLAGLRPPQVSIHLGKELIYRQIRQRLLAITRLGLGFAGAVRAHRPQILLPNP